MAHNNKMLMSDDSHLVLSYYNIIASNGCNVSYRVLGEVYSPQIIA